MVHFGFDLVTINPKQVPFYYLLNKLLDSCLRRNDKKEKLVSFFNQDSIIINPKSNVNSVSYQ